MFIRFFTFSSLLIAAALYLSIHLSVGINAREAKHVSELNSQKIELLQLKMKTQYLETNKQMLERFRTYVDAHHYIDDLRSTGAGWDIDYWKYRLIERLGYGVDVYLIDPEDVIRETTFEPDLNLDFKAPHFSDAQAAFQQARDSRKVIVGQPTREIVTGKFKLYTVSAMDNGWLLQIGFNDPFLRSFFEQAQTKLEAIAGVTDVQLYMSGTLLDLLTGEYLPTYTGDKLALFESFNTFLETEYEIFKQVTPSSSIVVKSTQEGEATDFLYVELYRFEIASGIPYRVVAKVGTYIERPSWVEVNSSNLVGFFVLIALAWLIGSFLSIRNRYLQPLHLLSHSIMRNLPVVMDNRAKVATELQYVIDNYNMYRSGNEKLAAELRRSATIDPLTGLYNRSVMPTLFDRLAGDARRNQRNLAVALFDLDHFKEFNDRYGHQAGDEALISLSDIIHMLLGRPSDTAVRYGGEEILVYFEAKDFDTAYQRVEEIRSKLTDKNITHEGNPKHHRVTVSQGLVVVSPNYDIALDKLIEIADQALYQAKEQGRNRTQGIDKTGRAKLFSIN